MSAQTAARKIAAARTALVLDQPFWGSLVLRIKSQPTTDVAMAATDGTTLYYNEDYVDRIPQAEVLGLHAEEIGHCAMGHIWRRNGRDARRWNIACDFALCHVLREAGFDTGDMIYEAKYAGKTAEWIYDRLPQDAQQKQRGKQGQPQPGQGDASGAGAGGRCDVIDPQPSESAAGDDADGESSGQASPSDDDLNSESDWQLAVQQAAMTAKMAGKLPASLDRFVKQQVAPRVDWRSALRRFVQQAAKSDYSWTRPNSRHIGRGMFLPALRSESMPPLVVIVDTSGSVDDVTLKQFASEITAIAEDCMPEYVHVIYCDAKVQREERFEKGEPIVLHAKGGGGTSFIPALDALDALDEEPACAVYLTDLYGTHRQAPPNVPLLWACISSVSEVPYGELISLER